MPATGFYDFNNGSVNVACMHSPMAVDGSASIYFSTTPIGSKFQDRRLERVRITGEGNVGIGTTTPAAKLNVIGYTILDGTVTVGRQNTVDEGGQICLTRASDNTVEWNIDSHGSGTGTRLRIHKDLGGEKMTILDNGNVGIGLINPISKLHVAGIVTLNQYQGINSVDNTTNLFIAGGSNWDKGGSINLFGPTSTTTGAITGGIMFSTGTGAANAGRMVITSGGNVGIGTSTPGETGRLLTIFNNASAGTVDDNSACVIQSVNRNANLTLRGANGTGFSAVFFENQSSAGYNIAGEHSSGSLLFRQPGGVERMRLDAAGNVGIGTIAPNQRLTVIGNISAVGNVNVTGGISELFSSNSDSILRTKSSYGNAIIELDNAQGSVGSGPVIVFESKSLPFAEIKGNTSLSAVIISTENTERTRISKNGLDVSGNLSVTGNFSVAGAAAIGVIVDSTSIAASAVSYTLKIADANKRILCNNTNSLIVTIPANVFNIGTEFVFMQRAGAVTFSPAEGVVLRSNGSKFKTNGIHAAVTLTSILPNEWCLWGNTAI